jgi:hypothetical protein
VEVEGEICEQHNPNAAHPALAKNLYAESCGWNFEKFYSVSESFTAAHDAGIEMNDEPMLIRANFAPRDVICALTVVQQSNVVQELIAVPLI